MAFNKIYSGSFVSLDDHIIKVDILKDGTAPSEVGELTFPAETPLTIEWSADSKRETIQGSTATLTIISPGDRTYIDMYVAEVGSVRMDVYRDNALWWQGTLDTEFYEEPFSTLQDYNVTMTFGDLGILSRLKYDVSPVVPSLSHIISTSLQRAQLTVSTELLMATTLAARTTTTLDDIGIRSDNFTDEDGEVSTLEDVIKGILEPLDLHMRQWAGKVCIFDLHSLSSLDAEDIEWTSDDQVLGVDEVANSVTVTFSPYGNSELVKEGLFGCGFEPDVTKTNVETTEMTAKDSKGNQYAYATWYCDNLNENKVSGKWDDNYIGINVDISLGTAVSGPITTIMSTCKFTSYGNGETTNAVYQYIRKNTHVNASNVGGWGNQYLWYNKLGHNKVFGLPSIYVPATTGEQYYIRLTMPLLLSAAYNPFGAGSQGEAGNCEKLTKRAGYVMVPFRARLKNHEGTVIYHYQNGDINMTYTPTLAATKGSWKTGDYADSQTDPTASAWLSYHAKENRKTTNGIDGGWCENKQFVGIYKGENFESFKSLDNGQYMPLPPVAGNLEITIEDRVYIYDWGNTSIDGELLKPVAQTTKDLYGFITWHCYKQPTVDFVSYLNGKVSEVEVDDIEYRGTLLEAAKDDISIDTICGTASTALPGSRGQYVKASDGAQITEMSRAGRTDTAEQLLIGTLHSHYASRHAVLSGTMRLGDADELTLYKDAVLDIDMALTSATVDLINDEIEGKMIEVNQDNYDSL